MTLPTNALLPCCGFPCAVLAALRGKYRYACMMLLAVILEAYLYLSGARFAQYAMQSLLQLPLFLNELYLLMDRISGRLPRIGHKIYTYFTGTAAILVSVLILSEGIYTFRMVAAARNAPEKGYEALLENRLDDLRRDSFCVYGSNNDVKAVYLRYELTPDVKFCFIQPWHAGFSSRAAAEIKHAFEEAGTVWILLDNTVSGNDFIRGTLSSGYTLAGSTDKFSLYRRKF